MTGQDYAEIQQLHVRYNFAVDAIDGEGVAAVYTPDGTFNEDKNRQFVGHDALVNWVNTEVKTNHSIDHRRHWNANLMITGTPEGAGETPAINSNPMRPIRCTDICRLWLRLAGTDPADCIPVAAPSFSVQFADLLPAPLPALPPTILNHNQKVLYEPKS